MAGNKGRRDAIPRIECHACKEVYDDEESLLEAKANEKKWHRTWKRQGVKIIGSIPCPHIICQTDNGGQMVIVESKEDEVRLREIQESERVARAKRTEEE